MATSKKEPIRATFSRNLGNGKYENVSSVKDATGVHIHRNDATAKQFKAKVSAVAAKLEDFDIQKQESNYALLTRRMSQDVDELIDSL